MACEFGAQQWPAQTPGQLPAMRQYSFPVAGAKSSVPTMIPCADPRVAKIRTAGPFGVGLEPCFVRYSVLDSAPRTLPGIPVLAPTPVVCTAVPSRVGRLLAAANRA